MKGNMSDGTRKKVGLTPRGDMDDLGNALGVSKMTPIVSEIYKHDPILKAEKELLNTQHMDVEDDPFTQLGMTGLGEKGQILDPTYNLVTLKALTHQNNTLLQAVSAMEVNIDGTGYEIERKDGAVKTEEDDKKTEKLQEFFDEPWPGMSFVTIRRELRRDLESTGNAYLEVIRNKKGEIVFLRHIDAMLMRMMKLEDAVPVAKKIKRGGSEINVKVLERPRKYVQKIGDTKVRFFKDFGVERELNADTGEWADEIAENAGTRGNQEPAPAASISEIDKANELIHFSVLKDVLTPYGVPRWINNLPSVLGSRKAEEFNLEFFDHGGLPPAMILIQGGQLSNEARTSLTNYLSGKAKIKQRGIIAEIFAASGDLGSAGNVKVSVERFGDERQKDAMFATYDDNCAEHVRISFRLPPMFLGLSEAYNFATAYTAYMIAEAQVFLPERDEFDEKLNLTIMKELSDEYLYRSKSLNVVDVEQKLKAMELSKEYQNPSDFIDELNEIVRANFTAKEGIDDEEFAAAVQAGVNEFVGAAEQRQTARENVEANGVTSTGDGTGRVLKVDFDDVIRELADDWAAHLTGQIALEDSSVKAMGKLINHLDAPVRKLFDGYVGMKLSSGGYDDDGVSELLACVGHRHDSESEE
jgi:PBSX family phage portal protein